MPFTQFLIELGLASSRICRVGPRTTFATAIVSITVISLFSLVACGGGGGGGGSSNPTTNSAPVIRVAQVGPGLDLGIVYRLDASGSSDADGDQLTYQWIVSSAPTGRAPELGQSSSSVAELVLHRSGSYVITLRVSDGKTLSERQIQVDGVYANQPAFLETGCEPMALAVGDTNGDGRKDIVTLLRFCDMQVGFDTWLQVLQQGPGLTFSEVYFEKLNLGLFATTIGIADMNNDGQPDIVVPGADAILIYYQQPNGTLGPRVSYTSSFTNNTSSFTQPSFIRLLDVNGDGRTDVVGLQGSIPRSAFEVYFQNSGGGFDSPIQFPITGNGYTDMRVGDLNGDGRPDVAFSAGGDERQISVNYLAPGGGFLPEVLYTGGIQLNPGFPLTLGNEGIAVGDVNSDGRDDLVMSHGGNSPNSHISIGYQSAAGDIAAPDPKSSLDLPGTVRVGDINGDGLNDVVVRHEGFDSIGVYMQNANGQLLNESVYTHFPTANSGSGHDDMVIADIDNDGFNDVLAREPGEGIWVWFGDEYFGN